MGCVMQVGEQGVNIARNAVLAAGWPETVPGTTVDRQCGSVQQAAHFAAQGVIAGAYDVVVAGGRRGHDPRADGRVDRRRQVRLPVRAQGRRPLRADRAGSCPQGISAELIADKWGISREDMDAFGAAQPAATPPGPRDEGRFEREILPGARRRGHAR